MWANYYPDATICSPSKRLALLRSHPGKANQAVPVAVIPLRDTERVLLDALYAWGKHDGDAEGSMQAALTAIGALPKKRTKPTKPKSKKRYPVEFENAEMGDEG